MIVEYKKNFSEITPKNGAEIKEFDREAEKKDRREIRKMLTTKMSEVLRNLGFKKAGYSLWSRKVGGLWHIVYLQRSQWSHQYYIEGGFCNEKVIPGGE
mgnify:FL=1